MVPREENGKAAMRNISFFETQDQVRNRTKTETRRDAWWQLEAGTYLQGVNKCQGLKPGEHPEKLAIIRVEAAYNERLCDITQESVIAEGFPDWTPEQFVTFYCQKFNVPRHKTLRVIRFSYKTP